MFPNIIYFAGPLGPDSVMPDPVMPAPEDLYYILPLRDWGYVDSLF